MSNTIAVRRLAILLSLPFFVSCHRDLRGANVHAETSFHVSENIVCTAQEATAHGDIGSTFTIVDLQSDHPRAVFSGTGVTTPLRKESIGRKHVTLFYVSPDGGTEAILVDPTTGKFARATATNILDVYAYASVGSCK